ncbi:hypothetical protein OAN24_05005 [Pseudodesulfovibrio sp.]|nr:hypothetical protein [Pseudodesulfovibrio sp.]
MTIPIIIFVIATVGLFFFLKGNSQKKSTEIQTLESEKHSLQSKYDFMVEQRNELVKLIQDKENELSRLRSGLDGIQTLSTREMNLGEVDESDKVSRYLLKEGIITLEQDDKVRSKMGTMKMDYLAACLTLGIIDLDVAKKAAKINKLATKLG